jgi:hypothetical protein
VGEAVEVRLVCMGFRVETPMFLLAESKWRHVVVIEGFSRRV